MRIAVILLAGVAACGQSRSPSDDKYTFDLTVGDRDRDRDHDRQQHDPGRYAQQLPQQLVTPDKDPVPGAVRVPPPAITDEHCVDSLAVTDVHYRGDKLYACDGTACATFSRATGKFVKSESLIAVEADDPATPDATLAPDPPDPDTDDPRATVDDSTVTGCPEDSACVRFMPLMATDDQIDSVRIDAKHRAVAVTMSNTATPKTARVEVWDLATGRMRGRTKYDRLVEDETYTFQTRAYGDGFVAFAKRDDSSRATAWAIGLDGARHSLAGGATRLSVDKIVEAAPGALGLLDPGDAGAAAVTVWLQQVPTGAVLAKASIPMASDDVEDISLLKVDRGMLGVAQWKSDSGTSTKTSDAKLRIDVLDPHGPARTFIAPGC